MRLIFTLVIFFLPFWVSSQSFAEEHYHFDVNQKMMKGYYNRGLYQEATQYVDSLEGNRYVSGVTNYFIARVYSLNNQFDKTLTYLEKAVKGGIVKSDIEKMYDLDKFRESHLYIVFELNYEKWRQEYLDKISSVQFDSLYIKELEVIKAKVYKNRYWGKEKKYGGESFDSKDSLARFAIKLKQDSVNFNGLVSLILERGFPTYRKVGGTAFDAINILRHDLIEGYSIKGSAWEKIKPMITKEMELGRLKPFILGQLEDRDRVTEEKPQVYYTVLWFYMPQNEIIATVDNPKELNIRRKSIGLCPIQVEYWAQAQELPSTLQTVEFK